MASKWLAQAVFAGANILGRAFLQSYRNVQLRMSPAARAARAANKEQDAEEALNKAKPAFDREMSLLEAQKVIDLPGVDATTTHPSDLGRLLAERFNSLSESNSLDNGGSVYMQAKIATARNVIEEDFMAKYGQPLIPPPPSAAELARMAAAQSAEDAAAAERKAWEDRERAHQLRVKRNKMRQAMQNEEILNKKRSQEGGQ